MSLSEPTYNALRRALPSCYSQRLDDCLGEDKRNDPACAFAVPIHDAYDEDFGETDAIVEDLPFCELPYRTAAIAGGAGILVGIAIGALVWR